MHYIAAPFKQQGFHTLVAKFFGGPATAYATAYHNYIIGVLGNAF